MKTEIKPLDILANISFYERKEKLNCKNNTGFTFSIRKDMFNYGRITFIDRDYVTSGDKDIKANICFLHGELVSPFLSEGFRFVFGSMTENFGEGIVLKIIESPISCSETGLQKDN
jgi:hypothetical protein